MISIILPVDFSEATDKLVAGAVKFAKEVGGQLCVIHIAPADLGFAMSDIGVQYYPEVEKSETQESQRLLQRIEETISQQGIACETELRQGVAKDLILDYAEEKNASYIVMGSHGRSGIYDVFVGSLTKELTKNCPLPVLVIPIHGKGK